ncbi:MAG: multidrug efflux RND transporter permease subunit [Nitrospiraceae bacterium]|nr:multidrug efflux RND transporter permease subunit [Nitrospiraceae bacterium]
MNISELFIRRPVMTTLVMLAIMIFGFFAYELLPVSDLPNVDFPTIQVTANLPGASPETMASAVATPLERQFSTIAGVDSMTSKSALGITQITLQFALEKDIDAAAQDVQSMISMAQKQLPADMPTPPSYRKVNPADQPVFYLALTSPTLPLSQVHEYADTLLAQRISMVSGVAQVMIYGSQKYAVRAQLDPDALASRGIGIDEIASAVSKGNVNLPTGTLDGSHKAYTIQASGQLYDAAAYRPLIVAYRNGNPVRLNEVGRVIDDVENNKIAAWYNNTRGIVLAIQKQPGTNTIKVVDSIKAILPMLKSQMPASVDLHIRYDRSVSIRDSVSEIKFTLALTIALVVMVIFLFLRNLSATIIPSLALPISIIGTFAAMYLMGFSINNLSLMALTLSVGFVVDDAIVMLENIVRHMEKGEKVFEAALRGSREIGFTIISMTLSLVAVFFPVLFMGGILGRLLHEFALTISMAILISGLVSLTLTPMLCSRFLKPHTKEEKHGRAYQFLEKGFNGMLHYYEVSLKFTLRHRFAVLVFSMMILVATVFLFKGMPMGFLPADDIGMIVGFTEAQQGISFESLKEHQQAVAAIVAKDPNVKSFMSSVGAGGPNPTSNAGRIFIDLKPKKDRKMNADQIVQKLRPQFTGIPGIQVFLQNPPPIRIGGQLTKSQYQFTIQSPDIAQLYTSAVELEKKMKTLPQIQQVTSDLEIKNPQLNVDINRDQASALGISAHQIEDALYTAYGSRQVSTIYAPNNQYQVIMELKPEYQKDPAALSKLYVRSDAGQLVPLNTLVKSSNSVGPLTVNHLGQLPSVTISFDLKEGIALGTAVDAVQKLAKETLPDNISTSFQGSAQAFQSSMKGLWLLLILSIIIIYIVLGILYESFIHPITILSGLPSAAFGALVTLIIFGIDLNIYAFVGVIMLIGIVKKNAIMMIDFALDAQRKENKNAVDAIYQGAIIRFRPIMMTTMAALMGTLPIAMRIGASAESRQPLGLAVVGGLLFSQFLTLYITPVIFIYLDSLQSRLAAIRFRKTKAAQAVKTE